MSTAAVFDNLQELRRHVLGQTRNFEYKCHKNVWFLCGLNPITGLSGVFEIVCFRTIGQTVCACESGRNVYPNVSGWAIGRQELAHGPVPFKLLMDMALSPGARLG